MDEYIKKGLSFNRRDRNQVIAADILSLMGRRQTEFISMLVSDFIEKYNIDPDKITRKELNALIILRKKDLVPKEQRQTGERKITKSVTESENTSKDDDILPEEDDEVDKNMLSQINMFG